MRDKTIETVAWLQFKLRSGPMYAIDIENAPDRPAGMRTVKRCKAAVGILSMRTKKGWLWYDPSYSSLQAVKKVAKSEPDSIPQRKSGRTLAQIMQSVNMVREGQTPEQVQRLMLDYAKQCGTVERVTVEELHAAVSRALEFYKDKPSPFAEVKKESS